MNSTEELPVVFCNATGASPVTFAELIATMPSDGTATGTAMLHRVKAFKSTPDTTMVDAPTAALIDNAAPVALVHPEVNAPVIVIGDGMVNV